LQGIACDVIHLSRSLALHLFVTAQRYMRDKTMNAHRRATGNRKLHLRARLARAAQKWCGRFAACSALCRRRPFPSRKRQDQLDRCDFAGEAALIVSLA
jgi:hypothetical protein